jgi:hypothetical protein
LKLKMNMKALENVMKCKSKNSLTDTKFFVQLILIVAAVIGYDLTDDPIVPVQNINLLFHDLADLLNMVIQVEDFLKKFSTVKIILLLSSSTTCPAVIESIFGDELISFI